MMKINYTTVRGGILLSHDFGVVPGNELLLTVTTGNPNHKIYYTTNGTPAELLFAQSADSDELFLYDAAGILLSESTNPDDFELTPNIICGTDSITATDYDYGYVSKSVSLSLIEVDENGTVVAKKRGTYIFHADGAAHFGTAPLICLSAPVDDWIGTDKLSGVYNTLDEELKIRAHLEYYDYSTNEHFSLNTQIKRGGNWTKNLPLRTLNANFKKDENGNKNASPVANIFCGRMAIGMGEVIQGKVRRFRLHSGGNCAFTSHFGDAFVQRIISLAETNVATAAYRPCVLYLNGEYWGLYALREHYDEDYLEYMFGVDADDVVYIDKSFNRTLWKPEYIIKSDSHGVGELLLADFLALLEISKNEDGTYTATSMKDWTSAEIYDEFCKAVDIDSLIDLILIEGYIGNTDFIGNNVRMWRTVPEPRKNKSKKSAYDDGKWRFMLHDTDNGMRSVTQNAFNNYLKDNRSLYDHRILSLPSQNEAFKTRLWERAKYIQKIFESETAISVIDEMESEIEPLYADKVVRWQKEGYSVEVWKNDVEKVRQFLRDRPNYFLDDVRSAFCITED